MYPVVTVLLRNRIQTYGEAFIDPCMQFFLSADCLHHEMKKYSQLGILTISCAVFVLSNVDRKWLIVLSYEIQHQGSFWAKQGPLKVVTMGTEAGIPLTHQLKDPSAYNYLGGTTAFWWFWCTHLTKIWSPLVHALMGWTYKSCAWWKVWNVKPCSFVDDPAAVTIYLEGRVSTKMLVFICLTMQHHIQVVAGGSC